MLKLEHFFVSEMKKYNSKHAGSFWHSSQKCCEQQHNPATNKKASDLHSLWLWFSSTYPHNWLG